MNKINETLLPPALIDILSPRRNLAVALSGGLDSRFLCHAAMLLGLDVLAVHATGPHIPPADDKFAKQWARKNKLPLLEIYINPLLKPEIAAGSKERCYFCKKGLLIAMKKLLAEKGESERILCDGGHTGDFQSYRPGFRAVKEEGVISPLAMAGLDKEAIRFYAAKTGMDYPEQKARPCLLTRFNYGLEVKHVILPKLAEAEEKIAKFLGSDVDFRLRILPEPVLFIKGEPEAFPESFHSILDGTDFTGCRIEFVENISGFFDRK